MKKCVLLMICWVAMSFAGDSELLLNSGSMGIKLNRNAKGAVTSLKSSQGIELTSTSAVNTPLFLLSFLNSEKPEDKSRWISSAEAATCNVKQETTKSGETLILTCDGFSDFPAKVVCTARTQKGDKMIRWGITVTVPDGWILDAVQYPRIELESPLGSGADDDAAVMGATKGGIIRPSTMKTGSSVSIKQPGNMAAQFGCYYDDRCGFYTAAEDSGGTPKNLILEKTKDGIMLKWHCDCFNKGTFTLPYEVATGTFTGSGGEPADWRDAADIYKTWAEKQHWCANKMADRTDLPEWLKEGPAMVRFSRHWLAEPERIKQWISGYWKKHFPDMPLITAYWGWEKHGSWVTPDYFPIYPSDETFKDLIDFSRKLNCHAFPWPSGYHWTLTYRKQDDGSFEWDDREKFDQTAREHAVHNRDGAMYIRTPSWLRGGNTACMCGGDPWTRNWWNEDICLPLVKRGCEMIQVDQVVGGRFPYCYSTNHSHPAGPGPWMTDVFAEQLRTMLKTMQSVEPDSVVCFEEPNEWFNHLVGIQDYRNCEVSREWASVFNYIYHEYLPPFQSNPHAGDRVRDAHCLADGQMPHMVPTGKDLADIVMINGSFETDKPGGNALNGWDQVHGYNGVEWNGKALAETGKGHDGEGCLLLKNEKKSDIVQISQNIRVSDSGFSVGGHYRLSTWIKVDSMEQKNSINYGLFAPGLKGLQGGHLSFPEAGKGWQQVSSEFSIPEGCEMMRIMIHVSGPAEARVDGMTLEEILPDGTSREARYRGESSETRFMRRWVELYHGEGRPWLQHGRLLHPPRLDCGTQEYNKITMPKVFHNAFRSADGREAVVLANATHENQDVTLFWKGERKKLLIKADDAVLVK